jgi:hypothetical protein
MERKGKEERIVACRYSGDEAFTPKLAVDRDADSEDVMSVTSGESRVKARDSTEACAVPVIGRVHRQLEAAFLGRLECRQPAMPACASSIRPPLHPTFTSSTRQRTRQDEACQVKPPPAI